MSPENIEQSVVFEYPSLTITESRIGREYFCLKPKDESTLEVEIYDNLQCIREPRARVEEETTYGLGTNQFLVVRCHYLSPRLKFPREYILLIGMVKNEIVIRGLEPDEISKPDKFPFILGNSNK